MAFFKLTKNYNKLAWSKEKKLTLKLLSLILKIYKFAGYQLEIHIFRAAWANILPRNKTTIFKRRFLSKISKNSD